jgi:hypothetical protein
MRSVKANVCLLDDEQDYSLVPFGIRPWYLRAAAAKRRCCAVLELDLVEVLLEELLRLDFLLGRR